jgi:long-chain acyl-CoA synthetase
MTNTLYEHLRISAGSYPDHVALMHKVGGAFVEMSYRDLLRDVDTVAANLWSRGLRKGDSIGIFSGNRPEWVIVDLAAMKLGCVVVPIHPSSTASFLGYVAIDSRIKMLFVENETLLTVVHSIPGYLKPFKIIALFDDIITRNGSDVRTFSQLRSIRPQSDRPPDDVAGSDIASIVYTSGTTGEPKGVMLTHNNIVSNAIAVQKRFVVTSEDVVVSYLPLSHMFERTCGYYAILFAGGTIVYAERPSTVAEDIKTVRPTIFLAVPSVIEKAYHRVAGEIRGGSAFRRFMIAGAIRLLNAHANRRYKSARVPLLLSAISFICNRYVALKFRQLAGGRLRVVASGGAPLDRKIAKLYHILGFNIVEGYGLTETSPIVACHSLNDRVLGTVGKPLDGVEVRIGQHDEVLVRGPNVMLGYLNRSADTSRTIDADGWFHTGDRGRFDPRGNLIITGRIKEIIVTSNGEKVAPAAIEARLTGSRYIDQAVLFGNRKQFIVALIVPDREQVERFARGHRMAETEYAQVLRTQVIRDLIARQVDISTLDVPPHEKVRAFCLLPDAFTVENGLLTLTQKLRRNKIEELYSEFINELYESASRTSRSRLIEAHHAA